MAAIVVNWPTRDENTAIGVIGPLRLLGCKGYVDAMAHKAKDSRGYPNATSTMDIVLQEAWICGYSGKGLEFGPFGLPIKPLHALCPVSCGCQELPSLGIINDF